MSHLTQFPMVSLTVLEDEQGRSQRTVQVAASRLLVYEQHSNFTRLRLKEEGWLRVREDPDPSVRYKIRRTLSIYVILMTGFLVLFLNAFSSHP